MSNVSNEEKALIIACMTVLICIVIAILSSLALPRRKTHSHNELDCDGWQDYNINATQISFDDFMRLYELHPDSWRLGEIFLNDATIITSDNENIHLRFDRENYGLFKQWKKEKQTSEKQEAVLKALAEYVEKYKNEAKVIDLNNAHGHWIDSYPDIDPDPMLMYGICSICGFEQGISYKLNYCPNCGAIMDLEEQRY